MREEPQNLLLCHQISLDFDDTDTDIKVDIAALLRTADGEDKSPISQSIGLSFDIFVERPFGEVDGIMLRLKPGAALRILANAEVMFPSLWPDIVLTIACRADMLLIKNLPGPSRAMCRRVALREISMHQQLQLIARARAAVEH